MIERKRRIRDEQILQFQLAGGTFDHGELKSGVGGTRTGCAVREEQKQGFDQKHDSVLKCS